MEKNYNIDDIENFLNQEMDAADLAAFEKEMAADKELVAEVDFHDDVVKGIKNAGPMAFKELVSGVHSEMKTEGFFSENQSEETATATVQKSATLRSISLFRRLAIAASFALMIAAGYWVFSGQPATPEQLFANHFSMHEDVLSVEIEDRLAETGFGTNKATLTTLQQGINDYNSGNYSQAINQFNSFQTTSSTDALADYAVFYKAVALLKTGKITAAETALASIMKNDSFPLVDDAKWYLALAYLQQEKLANANTLLKDLSKTAVYKERAMKLLERYK